MGFGDIFSGVGDFLSGNSSWLKPLAQVGMTAYNTHEKNQQAQGYINFLRDQENQNYQNYTNNRDAYLQWYQQNHAGGGGRGRGGGSNNAAALAAQKKAMEREQQGFADARKTLQPWYDVGVRLLPNQAETYGNSLNALNMLYAYQTTPQMVSQMNQSRPAWQVDVPLPEHLKG